MNLGLQGRKAIVTGASRGIDGFWGGVERENPAMFEQALGVCLLLAADRNDLARGRASMTS